MGEKTYETNPFLSIIIYYNSKTPLKQSIHYFFNTSVKVLLLDYIKLKLSQLYG